MSTISDHMTREEFVAYLRKRQLSVSEFYSLLQSWFNLPWGDRKALLEKTGYYKSLKRSN